MTAPSAYAQVIEATRQSLVTRSAQYKWLVIALVLGGVAVLAAALLLRDARTLALFLLAPPGVITFFVLDLRVIRRWRATTLALWAHRELRLDVLAQTLRQVPYLPATTVEGMLACLPRDAADEIPVPARPALVQAQDLLGRLAAQRLLARAAAWVLALAALLATFTLGGPAVPVLVVVAAAGWLVLNLHQRARVRSARARLQQEWQAQAVAPAAAATWLETLDWQGLTVGLKREWLQAAT